MLGTNQLADLECRGERGILLDIKRGLLGFTAAILVRNVADRPVLLKDPRRVH